jgi:hypothetical protein
MTPWQHDPAMIDFRRRAAGLLSNRRGFPLNQRSAAGWTPIRGWLQSHFGVAMAANEFHTQRLPD